MSNRYPHREEKLKESRRLYHNIERRIDRMRGQENVPSYAIKKFDELRDKYGRNIAQFDESTMNNYLRDLKYIQNLKTSYKKAGEEYESNFGMIKEYIEDLPPDSKQKLWDIIGEIYSDDVLGDRFKYEAYYEAVSLFDSYKSPDEIIATLKDKFFRASLQADGDYDKLVDIFHGYDFIDVTNEIPEDIDDIFNQ